MLTLTLVLVLLVCAAAAHDVRVACQTHRAWKAAQWDCPDGPTLRAFARRQYRAAVPRVPMSLVWLIGLACFLLLVT